MMKTVLITGITGQDGSYLTELLLSKDYEVYGLVRRSSNANFSRISHLADKIKLVYGDLTDQTSLINIIKKVEPDEIYNLGSQSFVGESWNQPTLTGNVTGLGVTNLLEAIRLVGSNKVRIYQASSSEQFGKVIESPQKETTPFYPRSPYGVAKSYAHWMCVNYRESYGMHISNGILFNHESPRRGTEFVTRKISCQVAWIKHGKSNTLRLGNTSAKRDWGYAPDYCRAMHLMLQQDKPDDYVIATGETHSVQEFVELAFEKASLDWKKHLEIDKKLFRPAEVDYLVGDASKAKHILGWEPKVKFEELVEIMVKSDIEMVGALCSNSVM